MIDRLWAHKHYASLNVSGRLRPVTGARKTAQRPRQRPVILADDLHEQIAALWRAGGKRVEVVLQASQVGAARRVGKGIGGIDRMAQATGVSLGPQKRDDHRCRGESDAP